MRRRGFAVTREEMTLGSCSVAVPVLDEDGTAVAALGVVVHSVRSDLPRLAPRLQAASRCWPTGWSPAVTTRAPGWCPPPPSLPH